MKRTIIQVFLSFSAGLLLVLGFLSPYIKAPDDAAAYASPELNGNSVAHPATIIYFDKGPIILNDEPDPGIGPLSITHSRAITNAAYVTSAERVNKDVTLISTVSVSPHIQVTPNSLTSFQALDTIKVKTLAIDNIGTATLDWELYEQLASLGKPIPPPENLTAVNLILDDGTSNKAIGFSKQALWLNRFTPSGFPFTLTEIWIEFKSGTGINIGETIDLYVYEDADGNPGTGATHLASYNGVAVQSLDSFSKFTLSPPVTLNGPGDVLIAFVNRVAGADASDYPAAIDQTASQGRSWYGTYAGNPPDPPPIPASYFTVIDDIHPFFAGNWMIRGYGTTGTGLCQNQDLPWVSATPTSGLIGVGSNTTVNVTFDSTGLTAGTYTGTLCIDSNDLTTGRVLVPVTLEVIGGLSFNITKSASPVSVDSGGVLTYTLAATNTSLITATNIILTDTVPANTTLDTNSLNGGGSASGASPGSLITWNTGISLTANQAVTRTFVVTVDSGLTNGSTIANTGYVSASNASASTASNTLNTTVKAPALILTKSASSPVAGGGLLTYTLVIQNNGAATAVSVTITDTVPANTTLDTGSLSGDGSASGSASGSVITWTLGDMIAGETLTRTFVVTVDSNVISGTIIANTGYVSATNVSAGQTSNTVNSTVSGSELSLTKSGSSATVISGDILTYTLVAQNNGTATATSVVITDTVPADTMLDTNSLSGDGSATGSTPGSTITWNTGQDLASGQSLSRTFVVTVDTGLPNNTTLQNTGYVSASNVLASKASNTENTTVLAPGLDITKTVEVNAVKPGNVLTYTITLVNDGNANLTGVKITDTVPANQLASASDSPDTSGTTAGSIVTWTIGGLNINASVVRTMVVTVDGGTGHGTIITNIAYGSADPSVTTSDLITAIVDSKVPTNTILITPTGGITVSNPVMFQWSAADWTGSDSGFYRLTVTGSNDSISIQEATDSITTTQTSYTPTSLSTGSYTWTVTAEDKAGNTLVVGPAYFQIAGSGQEVYLPIILKNN